MDPGGSLGLARQADRDVLSDWSDGTSARAAAEKIRDRVAAELVVPMVLLAMITVRMGRPRRPGCAEVTGSSSYTSIIRTAGPDISQRYERWGWPATTGLRPDGTEIVKLRGFYSPKFFIPVLEETVPRPLSRRLRQAGRAGARAHPSRPVPSDAQRPKYHLHR